MGWIKIDRGIMDNWIWQKEPFDKAHAWIDLLLLANYEDRKTTCKGEVITCKRGDVNFSISYLANRWKWNRRTVRLFLKCLESDQMVSVKCTTHCTTITIVNYDKFQLQGTTKCTTKYQPTAQPSNTIKKYKKDKNLYIGYQQRTDYDFDEIEKLMGGN